MARHESQPPQRLAPLDNAAAPAFFPEPERKPAFIHRAGAASKSPRRIVHVSTTDLSGGAARAAYRLHRTLVVGGDHSRLFVRHKQSRDDDVVAFEPAGGIVRRLGRQSRNEWIRRCRARYNGTRLPGFELFRDDRADTGAEPLAQMPPDTDVINLHWVADFIDYRKFLPGAGRRAPLVWTLHDMLPFTGGCHYDLDCGRYRQTCGACPQLGSGAENDLSRKILLRKEKALSRIPAEQVWIVAGSEWMASAARRSRLFSRFNTSVIHCGVNTSTFRPRDAGSFRKSLEIPEDAFVILFAADRIENRRKGFSLLLEALRQLDERNEILLVTAGDGAIDGETGFPHRHLGRLNNDDLLSLYYSCGDCFVIPSIQEAFGLTALEAMACGTPAIGFDTGGIADLIRPGETGLLARAGDASDLANAIVRLIDHPDDCRRMGRDARSRVEQYFTLDRQADSYRKIYDQLLPAATRSTH